MRSKEEQLQELMKRQAEVCKFVEKFFIQKSKLLQKTGQF